jgi:UDP-2-acetamido-2,6-beta-L-arabino-hexul-4-ose reductase
MRVLITGSNGFIGKNLSVRLSEMREFDVSTFTRGESHEALKIKVNHADAVVHLAGVNRPNDPAEFISGNTELTETLCQTIRESARAIPLLLTSSTQATEANPYGSSKKQAEMAALQLAQDTGNPVSIFRLPNVFGKWCKPNYNSVVATFCHNIAHHLPIQISDTSRLLHLVHIDDVVSALINNILSPPAGIAWPEVKPSYQITLGQLAEQISQFSQDRKQLLTDRTGVGFMRALYATYVSYLPKEEFSYSIPSHRDERGTFVEMLKTRDSGQFSFLTARPGVTRGGHYHHTKTEKFLIIKGSARFCFKHILTNETFELSCSDKAYQIVETIPGWAHDITNVGDDDLIVMLWSNEVFDTQKPDTISMKASTLKSSKS